MTTTHVIRLRGPWEYECVALEPALATPLGRVSMPCHWNLVLGERAVGVVRFLRCFHRPGHLEPHEQLWLVVDSSDRVRSVTLNDKAVACESGTGSAYEGDLTLLLSIRNRLAIELERRPTTAKATQASWLHEVRLEVRSAAERPGP